MKKSRNFACTLAYSLLVVGVNTGCGAVSTSSVNGSSGNKGTTGNTSINLRNLSLVSGVAQEQIRFYGLEDWLTAGSGTHTYASNYNTASQLLSLKYAFQAISLCETVEATSGFGFGNTSGCTSLYTNNNLSSISSVGASLDSLISKFQTGDQFDLMSPTDIARLNSNTTTISSGSYNYVLVNWLSPIALTGSVTVGGTTLVTTPQTGQDGNSNSLVSSMTASSTPQQTYIQSPNGGTVFKFPQAQVISGTDTYKLDIIFNPVGVLNGCAGSSSFGNLRDGTNGMYMPMLPVSAVLRSSTDTLMKETYTITTSASYWTGRVDLYYLKSDSNKAVLAAQVAGLANPTDATCYSPDMRVFTVVNEVDGSLTLSAGEFEGTTANILTGFQRGTSASGNTVTFGSGAQGIPLGVTTGIQSAPTTTAYN